MENPERVTYFAATDARGKYVPFGIKAKDRSKHVYVIGKTGMGKSTLLENMAIQDIRNGEGLAFIDPHGGTADKLLDYIPQERIKDVVYFAPFDMEHPIAFNVMEDVGYDRRHLVVSGLMATFKKIWVDAWSARMEYILTNTLLALLEYPGATLLGVNRMYTDKEYRKKVVENIKDPVVKDFWVKEFAVYTDRYTQEATPAIQNKVGQFTGNPLIRNIIGQAKSSFDIRQMMDEKKILIINLSKGLVGETNMRLLGSMLTTRIFLAAMSRADLSGAQIAKLPSFYFYVDEFQNFANETFAEILSEARKYKLSLTIAHQYVEQMEEEVRAAVFGNVGTTVAFRVGPFDAETLETIFMPTFTKEDLVNLGFAQIYLTLMIDGVGSAPFSAVTIPSIEAPPASHRNDVVASSRQQFSIPRAQIEKTIAEELATIPIPEPPERRDRRGPMREAGPHEDRQAAHRGNSEPMRSPRPQSERQEERGQQRGGPASTSQRFSDLLTRPSAGSGRPFAPRFPDRHEAQERLAPQQRSADDLKAILRSMTAKNGEEKEKKQADTQQSLKGTLEGVLAKNREHHAPRTTPETEPREPNSKEKEQSPKETQKPAPIPPEPRHIPSNPTRHEGLKQRPFEVSEDTLRKVLKGEA